MHDAYVIVMGVNKYGRSHMSSKDDADREDIHVIHFRC